MHIRKPPEYNALAWNTWVKTPLGQYLVQQEQVFYQKQLVPHMRGTLLSWLLPEVSTCLAYPDRMRILRTNMPICTPSVLCAGSNIVCDPCHLPLNSHHVDVILMPHVLDYLASPLQALQEAARVLSPEGRLIITGFNPLSLWGARYFLQHKVGKVCEPWSGHWQSLAQMKRWCDENQLQIIRGQFMGYNWPINHAQSLRYGQWLDAAGDRWFPSFAAVYGLVMTKRLTMLAPVSKGFPATVAYAKWPVA